MNKNTNTYEMCTLKCIYSSTVDFTKSKLYSTMQDKGLNTFVIVKDRGDSLILYQGNKSIFGIIKLYPSAGRRSKYFAKFVKVKTWKDK